MDKELKKKKETLNHCVVQLKSKNPFHIVLCKSFPHQLYLHAHKSAPDQKLPFFPAHWPKDKSFPNLVIMSSDSASRSRLVTANTSAAVHPMHPPTNPLVLN